MTAPLSSVVRVARSPEQAKIFVALLQGEGIPAHIEGDGLADEFAMSRRLMNLIAVRVMVPTSSLERAREVLGHVQIDDGELERQAAEAADPETPVPTPSQPAGPAPPRNPLVWPFAGAVLLAIVFFALWFDGLERSAAARDPLFDAVSPRVGVMEQVRRDDGVVSYRWHDPDLNLIWDRCDSLAADGRIIASSHDADQDGRWDRSVVFRDGWQESWVDSEGDGIFEVAEVMNADGAVVQRLTWKPGTGYVIEPR